MKLLIRFIVGVIVFCFSTALVFLALDTLFMFVTGDIHNVKSLAAAVVAGLSAGIASSLFVDRKLESHGY